MSKRLENRTAIITGAGSIAEGWGNGKATAVRFAQEGAQIVAVDINLAAAEETAHLVEREGVKCLALKGNVADARDVERLVKSAITEFGTFDILHNNVGINRAAPTAELSEEEWDLVVDVNLKSAFLTCKYAIPVMKAQGKGSIVNVSSCAAVRYARIPYIAYSASKSGMLGLTRTVALEHARDGIRANTILPGLLHTPMVWATLSDEYKADQQAMIEERNAQVPTGKMGDAWDVANAALFLASDEAKFINGAELTVDGGMIWSTG